MSPPLPNPPPQAPVTASPRLAFPEKFDGSPMRCKGFLLQCSMFVNQQPMLYSTDDSRIAFVCSLLTGRALEWATAVWSDERAVFPSFTSFLQCFREVFEHPAGGKEVGEQLLALRQGRGTAADYALSFRALSAQTEWSDDPLKLRFRKGLSAELQSELACRDEGKSLDQFIDLAIRIDNLIRSRRQPRLQFIRSFSTIAAPMTSMLKKGRQHLVWTQAAISAFQELKERFTTAPILHHPDPEREFIVEVDASSTGIGAVLSQRHGNPPKLYPCAFHSRKLTPTEQNYDVGNRELLAKKAAFEEWRHWLEGAKHPFTVLTDHRDLEYLKSAKRLNHRQARWALFFTRFDFSVTYRPGTQNTKADALSRLHESSILPLTHESIISPTIILAPIQWDIMTEITEAQATDPPPAETPPNRTYVPLALRQRVIQWVHSTLSSGHPGIAATVQLLTNRFWWSTLQADTITHIRNCPTCNVSKPSHQLPAGLLQPLPIPQRPWSHIAIDFITDLPLSGGSYHHPHSG